MKFDKQFYYDQASDAPLSLGKKHYLNYMKGKRLTQREAIQAQCFQCMGFYKDGRVDCESNTCSLYQFMPYRKKGTK